MRTVIAGLMAACGIVGVILLAHWARLPISAVPFVTSIVLVSGSPNQKAAAPRSVVLGHLICALVGFAARAAIGPEPFGAAIAVGVAVGLMLLLDVFHPPAGITPLIVFDMNPGYSFLLVPVAAGIVLVVTIQILSQRLQHWFNGAQQLRPADE